MGTLNDAWKRLFFTANTNAADVATSVPILDANNNPIGQDTYANLEDAMGMKFRNYSALTRLPVVWKIWDNGGGNQSVVLKIIAHRISANAFFGSIEMVVGGVGTSDRTRVISAECLSKANDKYMLRLYKKIEDGVFTYYVRIDTSLNSATNRVFVTQLTGLGSIDAPVAITEDVENVQEYNFDTGAWVAKASINAD